MTEYAYDPSDPLQSDTPLLIVPVFEGPEAGPGANAAGLLSTYEAARLTGKKGQNLLVPRRNDEPFAAGAVLMVGVGPKGDFGVTALRRSLGTVAGTARRFGDVATTFALAVRGRRTEDAVQAAAEGLGLGAYRFGRYKTDDDDGELRSVTVLGAPAWNAKAMRAAVQRADVIVDAVAWARDLVNTPAGDLPPARLAEAAQAMAEEVGLECRIWDERELEEGGFGGILGVGKGSVRPPRLIELRYARGGKAAPLALSGKGITFDSGGLSIKTADGMETMKDDMGGAASILATMKVIARLKPRLNVIAAIPCSENMPSGSAQKPGDVIHHYGGTTSEVLNTDAEGRLILADALAFLAEQRPELIVDTATLTGACMVALGSDISGAMGNDDPLARELMRVGEAVGEPLWQLPLHPDYRRLIDSSVADIKNTGKRWGGAITAAWFLAEFVGDTPWVHLDIAGPAFAAEGTDLGPKGATGVPVRTLVRFLLDRAAPARSGRARPER